MFTPISNQYLIYLSYNYIARTIKLPFPAMISLLVGDLLWSRFDIWQLEAAIHLVSQTKMQFTFEKNEDVC